MILVFVASLVLLQVITIGSRSVFAGPPLCPYVEQDSALDIDALRMRQPVTQHPDMLEGPFVFDLSEVRDGFPSAYLVPYFDPSVFKTGLPMTYCRHFLVEGDAFYRPSPPLPLNRRFHFASGFTIEDVARAWLQARFGDRLLSREQMFSAWGASVSEYRQPVDLDEASVRLFEVTSASAPGERGIVCLLNWGWDDWEHDVRSSVARPAWRSSLSNSIWSEQVITNHEFHAYWPEVCATLITHSAQLGWTPLPSFLSSNWPHWARAGPAARVVWAIDRLSLQIANALR